MATQPAYYEALQAVRDGNAVPHALWISVANEGDRDGCFLKPGPWEGSGQYQRVDFLDGRGARLVRDPMNAPSLIDAYNAAQEQGK